MAIRPLKLKENYFESIKLSEKKIQASQFDYQYNIIAEYINDVIIDALDKLIKNVLIVPTLPWSNNLMLRNIGDGTTQWFKPNEAGIENQSLDISTLAQDMPATILVSNNEGSFDYVRSNKPNQVVIMEKNTRIYWGDITPSLVEYESITEDKIANNSLDANNFQPNVLTIQMIENVITSQKIKQHSIPTEKLVNGFATPNLLGNKITEIIGGSERIILRLHPNTIPDGFFRYPDQMIFHGIISLTNLLPKYSSADNNEFIPDRLWIDNPWDLNSLSYKIFSGAEVAERAFEGKLLLGSLELDNGLINNFLEDDAIGVEHLPPSYRQKLGL